MLKDVSHLGVTRALVDGRASVNHVIRTVIHTADVGYSHAFGAWLAKMIIDDLHGSRHGNQHARVSLYQQPGKIHKDNETALKRLTKNLIRGSKSVRYGGWSIDKKSSSVTDIYWLAEHWISTDSQTRCDLQLRYSKRQIHIVYIDHQGLVGPNKMLLHHAYEDSRIRATLVDCLWSTYDPKDINDALSYVRELTLRDVGKEPVSEWLLRHAEKPWIVAASDYLRAHGKSFA